MLSGEENYKLLMEIQANRDFILQAYRQNPELLKHADTRIRQLVAWMEEDEARSAIIPTAESGER
jgi:hypothetical protein